MASVICGLNVSPCTALRRTRLLPVPGEVLVREGATVRAEEIVAKALLLGPLVPQNVAAYLGVSPRELSSTLSVAELESIECGQVIAERKSMWGILERKFTSPVRGRIESISSTTGYVMIRADPEPLELRAYLPSKVVEVIPEMGVILEAEVAQVQGIFGLGGEALGELTVISGDGSLVLREEMIPSDCRGAVIVWDGCLGLAAIAKMRQCEVSAVIAASAIGNDLRKLVGIELNPASTGNEQFWPTIVLTEGFGKLQMAPHVFKLLKSIEGASVSVNGATQIRAGVQRPEVIAPPLEGAISPSHLGELRLGSLVRIVRGPAFGAYGSVIEIPDNPMVLKTGARAYAVRVELEDKRKFLVPRPNVELIEMSH